MGAASAILTLLICTAAESNLLTNPGFEVGNGTSPTAWNRYVEPQPGALGRIDNQAHSGTSSVLLHTPLPYDSEPVNNWSQNVYTPLNGKDCQVGAFIRTVDAQQAALWVQCWKRGARRPEVTYTTQDTYPVQGTQDWQEVSLNFSVPDGIDFLTLRCVLLGTGSAWFDDVYLREAIEEKEEEQEETADSEEDDSEKEEKPKEPTVTQRDIEALKAEIEKLKEAHYVLAGAVDELRRTMRDQETRLREEIATLRKELEALRHTDTSTEESP